MTLAERIQPSLTASIKLTGRAIATSSRTTASPLDLFFFHVSLTIWGGRVVEH